MLRRPGASPPAPVYGSNGTWITVRAGVGQSSSLYSSNPASGSGSGSGHGSPFPSRKRARRVSLISRLRQRVDRVVQAPGEAYVDQELGFLPRLEVGGAEPGSLVT